jgi:hypothetical protein
VVGECSGDADSRCKCTGENCVVALPMRPNP